MFTRQAWMKKKRKCIRDLGCYYCSFEDECSTDFQRSRSSALDVLDVRRWIETDPIAHTSRTPSLIILIFQLCEYIAYRENRHWLTSDDQELDIYLVWMIVHLVLVLRNHRGLVQVHRHYFREMNSLLMAVIDGMNGAARTTNPRCHHHPRMDWPRPDRELDADEIEHWQQNTVAERRSCRCSSLHRTLN